ncbi:PREDICTED: uncharacterized protein LOC109154903 [Ipomoea nil]|uniref:uncharacterized protein LOC109154903 n=1 Tax=Ipomoea nil TaxID=35883 RepID=UPI0009019D66|nr:PREDICTED: uncharacterized protein LOC109154903 [Ipomoea nil]
MESVNVVIDDSPDESVETIVTNPVTELPLGELNTADNNSQPKSQESSDEDQESSEQETTLINDTGYKRGSVDKTLFVKATGGHVTIAQIYVDDIVFGSTLQKYTDELVKVMKEEFEMTPISTSMKVSKDETGVSVDNTVYRSLIGRNVDDRKSTSGGCFFVGKNLVSWLSKKQNSISLSTAESEYIAAGGCCTQLVWMKQMLLDYGLTQGIMTLYCDNEIELEYIQTDKQLADILTKPLDVNRFEILRSALGICSID